MKKYDKSHYHLTDAERIIVLRRVLRLADSFLAKQPQKTLTTNGRSLMTWGEVREHIAGALSLRGIGR